MEGKDKKVINSRLSLVNSRLTEVRGILMESLKDMLGDKTHEYEKYTPFVTDEEECDRRQAISIDTEVVTLDDGSTIDLGDVGTDDLHSLVDGLVVDLFEE